MMAWISLAACVIMCLLNVLTLVALARTLRKLKSGEARVPPGSDSGNETDPDTGDEISRVYADDVLAEEESHMRKTRGAAAHSSDVCTHWDEEDERQADDEIARRTLRSIRGP